MKSALFILTLFSALVTAAKAPAEIIESRTDDLARANAEAVKSKGGPDNNRLELVTAPTRAGTHAFKHWISRQGERSELAMSKTKIGGEYWYGWSMFLPADFDHTGSRSIVMQLATFPTPRNGRFPLSANGSYMSVDGDGRLRFHLQRKGEDKDMVGESFTLLEDIAKVKGCWLDFVMHAKWTGQPDGFLRLWLRAGDEAYAQKLDWKGRTFWDDEDKGPYFKMGLYTGDPGWKGSPERTLYTDEYRLGDAQSSFEEVAPPSNPTKP
jgi:hypothetical protein